MGAGRSARPAGRSTRGDEPIRMVREGRYDRQGLAGWSPAKLAGARVVVVGAGAIGNEVVKNLALVGVGTVLLIDFDRVAPSNLTRCVLMREEDVGRPKATVAAERAQNLNPDVRVLPIDGDVEFDIGDAHLAEADAVLGCLDNAYARYVLNSRMRSLGRGWIDAGISQDGVQVTVFGTRGSCFACTLGERTLERLRERFSCTGLRRVMDEPVVPTTVVTAAMAAALVTQLAVDSLHGRLPADRRWTLLLGARRWLTDDLSADPECPLHRRRRAVKATETSCTARDSWADMIRLGYAPAHAALELDRPVVTGFRCEDCGRAEDALGPMPRIPQEMGVCPACQCAMAETSVARVVPDGRLAAIPLSVLGYAPGDRLRGRARRKTITLQLARLPGWERQEPVERRT